jgi:broad specificity phosphatase PhoE
MKPGRIILIRHGESEGNRDAGVYNQKPDYTLELTEKGREHAKAAGLKVKEIVGVERLFFYVSPFWRTRETFEQIASAFPMESFGYVEEPRLREQEWGLLRPEEHTKVLEAQKDAYGPFYYRFPDGESCADVYDRVSDFFGTMYRDFSKPDFPENAVIVTHGITMRLFLMRWFHWSVEEYETYGNPDNCQLVIMEKGENGKYTLRSELKKHEVKHKYQRPVKL